VAHANRALPSSCAGAANTQFEITCSRAPTTAVGAHAPSAHASTAAGLTLTHTDTRTTAVGTHAQAWPDAEVDMGAFRLDAAAVAAVLEEHSLLPPLTQASAAYCYSFAQGYSKKT
jgi:hypothetical protein